MMKELYEKYSLMPQISSMREVSETPVSGLEAASLEPEVRYDVPDCQVALVTGSPFRPPLALDYEQGGNSCNARGNCGLVSIANTLRCRGMDVTEEMLTKKAVESGLCQYDPKGNPSDNGGTTAARRQKLLKELNIDSDIGTPKAGGTLEDIADAVDCGKGVLISGNAGVLWNRDDGSTLVNGRLRSNHCVAVTGVARDASTGKIVGIYICDSGRGIPSDACRFLSAEEFHDFYTDVYGSCANITRKPIMEVQG